MKKFSLIIFILMIFTVVESYSQLDARQLPHYLNIETSFYPKQKSLREIVRTGKLPPEAYVKHDIPDKILSPQGFELINMSGTSNHQSETWITINPNNPLQIVGSANDFRYNNSSVGYKMAAYYTTDGGKTWRTSTTPSNMNLWIKPPKEGGMTNFDPGMAFNTKGWVFYSFGFTQTPSEDLEADNGVFVCRSKDGGKTWEDAVYVALEDKGTTNQPFHDRYMMTCDVNQNSPYKDYLYVTWKRFKTNPGICFSSSKDGGESWSTISLIPGGAGDTQSPCPAIGPNGEIYVAWQDRNNNNTTDAKVQKSVDGGKSWLISPKTVLNVRNHGVVNSESGRNVLNTKQNMRVSSYPAIDVDRSNGPRKGWVYVVMTGKDSEGKGGAFLSRSTDGGNTWSEIQKIDDNTTGTDVFFPAVSVDPVSGLVSVLFYSSQNDSKNQGVDAYLAISSDGINFSNLRVTPTTWYLDDPNDVNYQGKGNYYWGDYTALVAYDSKIYPCFWMPNGPNGNFWSNNIYTANITPSPKPPTNLTAVNTYLEPSKVVLNWTDPTQTMLGGDIGDFTIKVYRDNNEIGSVNKGVKTYTDNTAVDGTTYQYSLRTSLTGGLQSDPVSITVTAGGALEPMPPTEIIPNPDANGIKITWKNPSTHVDNSVLHDFDKILIYQGDKLIKTIEKPEIVAGEMSSTIIDLPQKQFYMIKLASVAKRGSKETQSIFTSEILAYSGPAFDNMSENFDNPNETLPFYVSEQGTWGKTSTASFSSPSCFTDSPEGNYRNNFTNTVIFAPANVTSQNKTLSFKHICIVDSSGDWGILRVSTDLQNWEDLIWYDMRRSKDFVDDIVSSKWFSEGRDLSKYVGKPIYVAFSLVSNPLKNKNGWFIDDLAINDSPTGLSEINSIVDGLNVESYPNPALGENKIKIIIPTTGRLTLNLYDIMGNKVMDILDENLFAGNHEYDVDISKLPQGVYYYNINLNGIRKIHKLIKL